MDRGSILISKSLAQKLDWDGLLTPKMTSPFALQSIFSGLSIAEHSRFPDGLQPRAVAWGNSSRPTGSFHFPRPQTLTLNLKTKRGHFYFGKNRTFLFWLDNDS